MLKPVLQSDLSDTESKRLAALHDLGILDTPPDAVFDALVQLAAALGQAPMAWIGLLDRQRIWLKASVGLPEAAWPREAALAEETWAAPEGLLFVPDLHTQPPWSEHPVRAALPMWRAYAGVALRDDQGLDLGTLALAWPEPLALNSSQQQALRDLACVTQNAIQAHAQKQVLARQAITDPITGLSNRAHFDQSVQVELAHAMRHGEAFSVLYMDLDGFKEINDGFGHAAGVAVLKEVAQRLRHQVRQGDVIARFGIDEFAVVMRHGAQDSAQVLARRIVKAVAEPITLPTGDVVGVGMSIGMAAYDDDVLSVKALMSQAEQSLYDTKKRNEKRWKTFMGIR